MKRVVVAIIAIAVAMGLSGCSSDAYDRIEELEEQCAELENECSELQYKCYELEDVLYDISELTYDAGDELEDAYIWVVSAHETMWNKKEYTEEEVLSAAEDLLEAWHALDDLEEILGDIRSTADDAR